MINVCRSSSEVPLFLSGNNETQIFEKHSNAKFHENPSSSMRTDGQA